MDDDYEHEDQLEYILENVLMPDDGSLEFKQLQDDYNSQLTLFCTCSDLNYTCTDITVCSHGGGYTYNKENSEMVLIQSTDQRYPAIIECNDLCNCRMRHCLNRRAQYGPRKNLQIFDSPLYKSKGLRSLVKIPLGAFICEYAGELLTLTEANRRVKFIDETGQMNYVLCLHEHGKSNGIENNQITTIVDPSQRGNIGRYLNHSCEPNCEILAVRINSPIPKIGIFAKYDISANEELCFHYGGESYKVDAVDGKPCLCAAPKCLGLIPNTKI